jgi:hypothetical protein
MKVIFHPKFAEDIRRHGMQYDRIAPNLGQRFRADVDTGIEAVKVSLRVRDIISIQDQRSCERSAVAISAPFRSSF